MFIAFKPLGWPLAVALAAGSLAQAGDAAPRRLVPVGHPAASAPTRVGTAPILQINTGRGRLVTLPVPITDLFIANDSIADVQVRSPTSIYIFGKATGETTLSATSKGGAVVYAATIRVGANYDSIQAMLALAMPEAHITATTLNGVVLLTGTVASPDDAAEAERLVQGFVGKDTTVLSRLRSATPLQVNLQVRVAEVNRSFVKNIGVNFKTQDTTGGFNFGIASGRDSGTFANAVTGAAAAFTSGSQRTTLGLAGHLLGLDLLSAIDLGETIGQVTTLANPNLTAISGETGSFLAGGEIPIPLSQGLGAVSVEYKQYGISLSYTPTVMADGRISMRVRPEVSQLDYANAVTIAGTSVPATTTRKVETTVELGSGESLMIGGLLSNLHGNTIDKTPGLGDLPILGSLFRSNGWRRNETELVIIITPYLVKPVSDPRAIKLPTDGEIAPTDAQRVLLGELGTGVSGAVRPVPTMAPPVAPPPVAGVAAPVAAAPEPSRKPKKGAPAPGFSN